MYNENNNEFFGAVQDDSNVTPEVTPVEEPVAESVNTVAPEITSDEEAEVSVGPTAEFLASEDASHHTNNAEFKFNYDVEEFPPKKKKGKGMVAAIVAAVILIGGGVTAFAFKDTIANFVTKTFSSPEKYYTHVLGNAFDENFDGTLDLYKESYNLVTSGDMGADVSLKVKLSDAVSTGLVSVLPELEGFESASLDLSFGYKNGLSAAIATKINDTTLISANAYANLKDSEIYAQVPELIDGYFDFSSALSTIDTEELAQVTDLLEAAFTGEMAIAPEDYEKFMEVYKDAYFDFIEESECVEKDTVEVKAMKLEKEYTELKVVLKPEDMMDLAVVLLETMKDDDTTKDILEKFFDSYSSSLSAYGVESFDVDMIFDNLDTAIDTIKEYADSDEVKEAFDDFTHIIYVDNSGDIIGCAFEFNMNGEKLADFTYATIIDGDEFATEGALTVQGEKYLEITGEGNADFSDLTADYQIKATFGGEEYTINAKVDNADTSKAINGIFKGDITLTTDLLEDSALKLSIDTTPNKFFLEASVKATGIKCGSFIISSKTYAKAKVNKPSGSDTVYDISNESDLATITNELTTFDIEAYVNDFASKAGLELTYEGAMELIEQVSSALGSLTDEFGVGSSDVYYDDEYDWEDDYSTDDFDWEDDYSDSDITLDMDDIEWNEDIVDIQ